MKEVIFDASAVLALLNQEPGYEIVEKYLHNGLICAVNFAEVVTVLMSIGMPITEAENSTKKIVKHIIPFDEQHALITANLRKTTKPYGLSLGDRACLALAKLEHLPVLTADKAWNKLKDVLQIKIMTIR